MNNVQKRGSVLVQYLFSYIGIALLSCALIGVVVFNMFLQNLEAAELANNLQKIELAVNDLEAQLDTMESISYNISFDIKYRPLYFQQNKYYEKMLLDDFKKYAGYSLISDQYFLLYRSFDSAFLSSGFSSPTSVLFGSVLEIANPAAFQARLDTVRTPSVLASPDSRHIFMAFPVRATADRATNENAVLCFVTDADILLNHITYVTGKLDGDLRMEIDGVQLAHQAMETGAKDPVLAATSPNGRVKMSLSLPKQSFFGKISRFRVINIIGIILFVLMLVGLAVLVAYRNFLPIKRINARIKKEDRTSELKNELLSIDHMFSLVQERNARTTEQMAEQMRLLKGQSLHLLLNGDFSASTLALLRQLGIKFPYECFTILQCLFPIRKSGFTDREKMDLFTLIEDLSSENILFYAVNSKQDNAITVLVNLKDESLLEEAADLVKSMLGSREEQFNIGCGSVYNTIHHISAALIEAMCDCDKHVLHGRAGIESGTDAVDSLTYETKQISRMLRAVRAGNYAESCVHLDEFIAQLAEIAPSLLMQRYVFSEVLVALVQSGREIKMPVGQHYVSAVLAAQDMEAFRGGVSVILKALCQKSGYNECEEGRDVSGDVLSYIQEHCVEYDLSLDKLAEEFSLSANYLSRLIKQAAGENYKDYVIQLKIDQAKKLLESGLTVAQTCENVGYSNISHFIKTFKQITGLTPSNYKKQNLPGLAS